MATRLAPVVVGVCAALVAGLGGARAALEPSTLGGLGRSGMPVTVGKPYTCIVQLGPERAPVELRLVDLRIERMPDGVRVLDVVHVAAGVDEIANGCLLGGDVRRQRSARTEPLERGRFGVHRQTVLAVVLVVERTGSFVLEDVRVAWRRGPFHGESSYGGRMELEGVRSEALYADYYLPD